MSDSIRILLLADTHLGFDSPRRPRVEKRRRGPDFLGNFRKALEPALRGEVDAVVHGGDVFHRSRVSTQTALDAVDSLRPVLARGIPVFIVPGNHERAALPFPMFWNLPDLHVFDRPRTVTIQVRGRSIGFSGFPYAYSDLRRTFSRLVTETGATQAPANMRVLCLHHAVEGATVGPADFRFRDRADTIPACDLPTGFGAVLSGHIHRAQVLRRDSHGLPLRCPVFYPGSVERTSFAEQGEEKGYSILEMVPTTTGAGRVRQATFHPLPTRPMERVDISLEDSLRSPWESRLRESLAQMDPASVVQVRILGERPAGRATTPSASLLRRIAPPTMSLEVAGR